MPHPTSDSAYGIWSLNEVRDAVRGDNWPSVEDGFDISPYSIGDSLGGGFYAGIIDTTTGNIIAADDYQTGARYALIVSPKSLEGARTLQWDSQGRSPEQGCITRWNGLESTETILAKNDSSYEIFEHVRSIRSSNPVPSDGGSDWYVPAMDEMEIIYRNFKPENVNNDATSFTATFPGSQNDGVNPSSDPVGSAYTSTVPSQTSLTDFQKDGAEAVELFGYYTSTDANDNNRVWQQEFTNREGYQLTSNQGKDDSFYYGVRPVRRILL